MTDMYEINDSISDEILSSDPVSNKSFTFNLIARDSAGNIEFEDELNAVAETTYGLKLNLVNYRLEITFAVTEKTANLTKLLSALNSEDLSAFITVWSPDGATVVYTNAFRVFVVDHDLTLRLVNNEDTQDSLQASTLVFEIEEFLEDQE